MNIDDLKELKETEGMTSEQISELSGIPLEVVSKIFSGEIEDPKYMTLLAIEQVLVRKKKIPFYYDETKGYPCLIREEATAYNFDARRYNLGDLEKLCAGVLVEVIDGKFHVMSTPSRMHQFFVTKILVRMENHIQKNKGHCHVYPAPFGVRLFADDETWVIPDILVICRKDIMTDRGCDGAPDLVVEIVSPNNASHDYVTKLMKYQQAGVREYWIVDPINEKITLYDFQNPAENAEYSYNDTIRSNVLDGFEIRIADFIGEYDKAEAPT